MTPNPFVQYANHFLLTNKYFMGLNSILINIGSAYLLQELMPLTQQLFKQKIMAFFILFLICFTSTRDLFTSLLISLLVYFSIALFLNEKSSFCLTTNNENLLEDNQENFQSDPTRKDYLHFYQM
jgi:hypothetical protein